jgi:uracil-DNA glycosylase family 4
MIKKLKNVLNQCKECPLYKEIMCFPNIGCGSENPNIMFILGGVDRDNLIFDKPFNDLSETVLLKSLEKANISSNICYVTSIIKCGSLKDKKVYIETCSKWLIEEINILKPKVLFFIGKKTFDTFYKLYGDVGIKTITEPNTLYTIFAKNSLMKGFVNRLVDANGFCERL